MAGVARIVIGVLLLIFGILLFFTILGIILGLILIIIGIVLIASGASARGDAERMERQQQQTNLLLQQQMQMNAMQMNRQAVPNQYPGGPPYATAPTPYSAPAPGSAPVSTIPIERYCPSCGAGNARASAFCQKCGKPLPPPQ